MGAGKILISSVIAPHKLDGTEQAWLTHAEAMVASHPAGISFFLAVEVDARGLDPYRPMIDSLYPLGASVGLNFWTYQIDKVPMSRDPYEITTGDRYIRIATGRNLAIEYALTHNATHLLHLDTDTEPPPDCLPKLLEVDRPLVFGHVPTYALDGPRMSDLPGDCRAHWSSAGFCLVSREAFRRVKWGWDPNVGLSDDPTYARDVEIMGRGLGLDWAPVTRHDVQGRHHPGIILPLEQRGTDRKMSYR